jgi:hypothetical protein
LAGARPRRFAQARDGLGELPSLRLLIGAPGEFHRLGRFGRSRQERNEQKLFHGSTPIEDGAQQ